MLRGQLEAFRKQNDEKLHNVFGISQFFVRNGLDIYLQGVIIQLLLSNGGIGRTLL